MDIKVSHYACILLCIFSFGSAWSSKKIRVERYENWSHPILKIFKQYGISVYKISYSPDGKCATFFADFKYSPDTRAPDAASFAKVYYKALKANSLYPYALVYKEEDMRINVGWEKGQERVWTVEMDSAQSSSLCKYREWK